MKLTFNETDIKEAITLLIEEKGLEVFGTVAIKVTDGEIIAESYIKNT
jgi:hypothetical protein